MKKIIKKIGRIPAKLTREDKGILTQKILVVDNGYTYFFQLESVIGKIRENFPKSKISILTLEHRRSKIEDKFPDVEILLANNRLCGRYQIALKMIRLRKCDFDFITLLSLDITPIIASLFFIKKRDIFLFNNYFEWQRLCFRKLNYTNKGAAISFKGLKGKLFNSFIYLSCADDDLLEQNILVIDNGYDGFGQIDERISNINEIFPNVKLHLLTFPYRKNHFIYKFPFIKVDTAAKSLIKRYQLALSMWNIRKQRFNYIILPSLDVSLIIASFFMKKDKLLLYNKWYQWWLIKFRSPIEIIFFIPKSIFKFIFRTILHIATFLYLLFKVFFIFIRKIFNILTLKTSKDGINV